jgi:glyoxylase-like metal-dependent hydrolase (beta-lactamase superfamily II)
MLQQIADSLYLIRRRKDVEFPFCHTYVWEHGNELVLCDPHCGRELLCETLEELGRGIRDIGFIVNTHSHADHSAANVRLKEESGARILMHEADAAAVTSLEKYVEQYGMYNELVSNWMKLIQSFGFQGMVPDQLFRDGDMVPGGFRVIHTPGHSPGHSCFLREDTLITGDIGLTDPWVGLLSCHVGEFLRSVERLQALDFRVLLPGHGRPLFESAHAELARFRQRILDRGEETFQALTGTFSLDGLVDQIVERRRKAGIEMKAMERFPIIRHFERITALNYLIYLKECGRVDQIEDEGESRWQRVQ